MQIPSRMVRISRVLNEDDDFIIMEVAKRDDVTFHMAMNDEGETVGGDRFYSLMFAKMDPADGKLEIWLPWEHDGEDRE